MITELYTVCISWLISEFFVSRGLLHASKLQISRLSSFNKFQSKGLFCNSFLLLGHHFVQLGKTTEPETAQRSETQFVCRIKYTKNTHIIRKDDA